jgi:cholesterol oxidase
MPDAFDVIVIGSGFGGAVAACRLAERGDRVLVLERGRRWTTDTYPREPGDPWIWDQNRPELRNGWLDFRCFDRMAVAQGAAVGGGSLIYANVSVDAPPQVFEAGWPDGMGFAELRPHYDRVAEMLGAGPIPEGQLTERFRLTREAAERAGYGDRFRALPLAVTFDPDWNYERSDAFDATQSRPWVNQHGQEQGTCVHCGNCCVGCPVQAKNTLDLNYLARAEQHGAEIRPLHLVRVIEPANGGYTVHFDRLENGRRNPGKARASRVVVSAGSLGSTELLLRCRDEYRTLPQLSPALGTGWSSNGDFLTPASYRDRSVGPTRGPTIGCAIDFLDGAYGGARFFIEDGGFPGLLRSCLVDDRPTGRVDRSAKVLYGLVREMTRMGDPLTDIMPWFAQGIDAADGRLRLRRSWVRPWRRTLSLRWRIRASEPVVEAILQMHRRLSAATGGDPCVPWAWRLLKHLVTPHPLGGCRVADSSADGVVNHGGEVFGYPRLHVADGSIIPTALGRNPSKTIAAVSELIVSRMDA